MARSSGGVKEAGGEPVAFGAYPDDEAVLASGRARRAQAMRLGGALRRHFEGAGDLSHGVVSRLGSPGVIGMASHSSP